MLTAFIVPTMTTIVSSVPCAGESDDVFRPAAGSSRTSRPGRTITPATRTWPASLVIASMPHLSSITPIRQISAPPVSSACASLERSNTRWMNGNWLAKSSPTASPASIATPPSRGIGVTWTSRSRTSVIAPTRMPTRRTSPVSRKVVAAATSNVRRYSRIGDGPI